jgi:hypothetical protein
VEGMGLWMPMVNKGIECSIHLWEPA